MEEEDLRFYMTNTNKFKVSNKFMGLQYKT